MRSFVVLLWALSLCLSTATAQQILPKEPAQYAGPDGALRVGARPPGLRLTLRKPREFALASLSEAEVLRLAEPGTLLKVGIQRKLAPDAMATGGWETTAEGTRVWRMALRSPGSQAMRVEFLNFSAGAGNVWLHDGDQVAGPYTGRGIYGDGHFWSAAIFSESVVLEYEPAAATSVELRPPFEIGAISHRGRTAILARPRTAGTAPSAASLAPAAGKTDQADYCELDANCFPEWRSTLNSVAQISFIDGGDEYLCSGSLVATRDNSFKPYFLTAGHCINNEAAARTLQAYWTYQTTACGADPPASNSKSLKSALGAHLVASGTMAEGDFSLVLLQDVPAGVTFAGWDVADPARNASLTGIHHPSGSWKRISFGQRVGDAAASISGLTAPSGQFLQVLWDKGRVEHGSSGSPLFSAPGVLVGSLSYGPMLEDGTVCAINPSVAGYSRFSNTYAHLKDYLENVPANLVLPDKPDLNFTIGNHTAVSGQSVRLTTPSTGQVTFKLRADASWIRLSAMTGSVSANSPGQVTITADTSQIPEPGKYSSTVTILSGAATPQFINVTAVVGLDQSNVVATITPGAVMQSFGRWSFQIRLQETAGVGSRLTALKFNGVDYSASIAAWFGTDRIAANSAIAAPLQCAGLFPPGVQYFELWGVDDASGQAWHRVAMVVFQ